MDVDDTPHRPLGTIEIIIVSVLLYLHFFFSSFLLGSQTLSNDGRRATRTSFKLPICLLSDSNAKNMLNFLLAAFLVWIVVKVFRLSQSLQASMSLLTIWCLSLCVFLIFFSFLSWRPLSDTLETADWWTDSSGIFVIFSLCKFPTTCFDFVLGLVDSGGDCLMVDGVGAEAPLVFQSDAAENEQVSRWRSNRCWPWDLRRNM